MQWRSHLVVRNEASGVGEGPAPASTFPLFDASSQIVVLRTTQCVCSSVEWNSHDEFVLRATHFFPQRHPVGLQHVKRRGIQYNLLLSKWIGGERRNRSTIKVYISKLILCTSEEYGSLRVELSPIMPTTHWWFDVTTEVRHICWHALVMNRRSVLFSTAYILLT